LCGFFSNSGDSRLGLASWIILGLGLNIFIIVFAPKVPGSGDSRLVTTVPRPKTGSNFSSCADDNNGRRYYVVVLQNRPIKSEGARQNDRSRFRLGTDSKQTTTGRRGGSDGMK